MNSCSEDFVVESWYFFVIVKVIIMIEVEEIIKFELKLFIIKIFIYFVVFLVGVVVFMELEWGNGEVIIGKFDVMKFKESLVEKYNISVIDMNLFEIVFE